MNTNHNKQIVSEFYRKVIGEQDLAYAAKIVREDYIQHNPQVKTGKIGFLEAITYLKSLPKQKDLPKPAIRMIAEGDYVAAHYQIEFMGQRKNVLDIFRLQNGLLAEHWDAIEDELMSQATVKSSVLVESSKDTAQHKSIVENFMQKVLISRDFDTLNSFLSDSFISHHSKIEVGSADIAEYYQKVKVQQLHRTIGQGNFVVTQSTVVIQDKDFVCYDIYRLANGLIEEHWSVSQMIPEIMAHDNGMI